MRRAILFMSLGALTIGGVYACGDDTTDQHTSAVDTACPDDPQPVTIVLGDGGHSATETPVACTPSMAQSGSSASSASGATTTSGGQNSSSGRATGSTSSTTSGSAVSSTSSSSSGSGDF